MSKLSRFLSLPSEDRQLVFRAWWVMLGFWTAIRTIPFRKVVEMAKVQLAQIDLAEVGPQVDTDRVTRCVTKAANNHLMPMNCLERSFTLQRILRQQGVAAELQIGVDRQFESISAHAWLEVGGRPIAQPEAVAERFLPILSQ